jgi:hypothetical protein
MIRPVARSRGPRLRPIRRELRARVKKRSFRSDPVKPWSFGAVSVDCRTIVTRVRCAGRAGVWARKERTMKLITLAALLVPCFAVPAPVGPSPDPAGLRVKEDTGLRFSVLESKIRRRIISTESPFGLKVRAVSRNSPAAAAGIEPSWILMRWNGNPIREVSEIDEWLWTAPAGAEVEVGYSRRKAAGIVDRNPWEDGTVRMKVTRVHRLRAAFGIGVFASDGGTAPEGAPPGVPVFQVDPGSAAAQAGVRSGDVIVGWDGQAVGSLAALRVPFYRTDPSSPGVRLVVRRLSGGAWDQLDIALRPAGSSRPDSR